MWWGYNPPPHPPLEVDSLDALSDVLGAELQDVNTTNEHLIRISVLVWNGLESVEHDTRCRGKICDWENPDTITHINLHLIVQYYIHSQASYPDTGDMGTPVHRVHVKCLSVAKIWIYDQFLLTLQCLEHERACLASWIRDRANQRYGQCLVSNCPDKRHLSVSYEPGRVHI